MNELTEHIYLVPKTALGFFNSGTPWWMQSALDVEYGKAMGLDEEQIRRIDAAVSSTLDDLARLEAAHSKLVSDADGNQFFEIDTFDGSGLQNALVRQIRSIVDGGQSEILADSLLRDPTFGGFGSYRQEISIEEVQTPGGGAFTGISVKFKHDINGLSRGYSSQNIEQIQKRFAPIYAKAGVALPAVPDKPANR